MNKKGYILIIVTLIGLVLAIIFGNILPKLHLGQQVRAITNLNETRAYEAARTGIDAVRLGFKGLTTLQDLIGPVSNNKGVLWAISELCGVGNYDEFHDADKVQVFIIVRAKGIPVSPGLNYPADLLLVNDVPGSYLPNPKPQILEAGFYLVEESPTWDLKVKRFWFSETY